MYRQASDLVPEEFLEESPYQLAASIISGKGFDLPLKAL